MSIPQADLTTLASQIFWTAAFFVANLILNYFIIFPHASKIKTKKEQISSNLNNMIRKMEKEISVWYKKIKELKRSYYGKVAKIEQDVIEEKQNMLRANMSSKKLVLERNKNSLSIGLDKWKNKFIQDLLRDSRHIVSDIAESVKK